MEVLREIKTITKKELIINLPDDFLNKEVEIVVVPLLKKETTAKDKRATFFKFVEENRFKLPNDYKFVRD